MHRPLVGDRLTLVPAERVHAHALAQTGPDLRYTFGPTTWSPAGLEAYLEQRMVPPRRRPFVVQNADRKVVGFAALIDLDVDQGTAELGPLWIAPAHQGARLGQEVARLLLDHAFGPLGLRRVALHCDADNTAARRLLWAIGAVFEGVRRADCHRQDGTLRDSMGFSILADEWPEKRASLVRDEQAPRLDVATLALRPATGADLDAIFAVECSAFGLGYSRGHLRQLMALAGPHTWVGEAPEHGIIAYFLASRVSESSIAWVLSMGVSRAYQRLGVGRALLTTGLRGLARHGVREVRLSVDPCAPDAVALYRAFGFVVFEEIRDYFGPGEHRLCLTLPLDPSTDKEPT